MIKVLEDGEAFYDTSYGEVKVIVHVSTIIISLMYYVCIYCLILQSVFSSIDCFPAKFILQEI